MLAWKRNGTFVFETIIMRYDTILSAQRTRVAAQRRVIHRHPVQNDEKLQLLHRIILHAVVNIHTLAISGGFSFISILSWYDNNWRTMAVYCTDSMSPRSKSSIWHTIWYALETRTIFQDPTLPRKCWKSVTASYILTILSVQKW